MNRERIRQINTSLCDTAIRVMDEGLLEHYGIRVEGPNEDGEYGAIVIAAVITPFHNERVDIGSNVSDPERLRAIFSALAQLLGQKPDHETKVGGGTGERV